MLQFLQRVLPTWTWTVQGPWPWLRVSSKVYANVAEHPAAWICCSISDAQLTSWARQFHTAIPPVWPGIDNVQLGTPNEFTESGHMDALMDGLQLAISAVGPRIGRSQPGTLTRYNYLGWITFLNDQGEADGFQRIEYEKTIYCPLHLEHASAADFFVQGGTSGVLTPWTILV